MAMTFGEVLAHFKKSEGPEVVVSLIEDPLLRKALIAWQAVKIEFVTPIGDCSDEQDEVSKWEWLWSRVKFDQARFGVVAGLKGQEVEPVLTRMKGLRLIYPDGSINMLAQQYLRSIVMAQLNKAKPKGQAAPAQGQPKK
jgi:hypothetical protein